MTRLYFKQNEILFFNALINMVENNINNENKINITAFTIAKETGLTYRTVRNKLKQLQGKLNNEL
ncbi:MAG: replication/maintenance protein RepL [Arcobacter sp.]|uniref:replication/maintenance protein RepL n=1 Tax=Arcobacter sp. TaxID=1872629 RepID=UPI003D057B5D